jgi:CheY-like chemotaxis protein
MTKPAFPTRLLIVERDEAARTFLRRRLSRLGYEVKATGEAAEALKWAEAQAFDLALVDLHGPEEVGADGASGFETVKRLRTLRLPAELKILAVGAEGAHEDVREALALGADDCLPRPLTIALAHSRIEMLTGKGRQDGGRAAAQSDLVVRLESLDEAAERTEALSAMVSELGHHVCTRLNTLLGAATVLTSLCRTEELKPSIATLETAAVAIDEIIVQALGFPERRNRAPKTKVRVLVVEHEAETRLALHQLLNATETPVELVETAAGLDAAFATDQGFFDLIVMNLASPDVTAGIRAIRRAERDNKTRRTPVLVFGETAQGEGQALGVGADLYVRQPMTARALLTALAEALVREAEDVRAVA